MPAPRVSDQPVPGHYLIRLVRNGPMVGARITHDDDGWSAMIDGEHEGPVSDPWSLRTIEQIHFYGRETTAAEVKFRIGIKRWAEIHKLSHPAANPRRAINPDQFIPF